MYTVKIIKKLKINMFRFFKTIFREPLVLQKNQPWFFEIRYIVLTFKVISELVGIK
jgi:hypothetical protein